MHYIILCNIIIYIIIILKNNNNIYNIINKYINNNALYKRRIESFSLLCKRSALVGQNIRRSQKIYKKYIVCSYLCVIIQSQ